MRCSIRESHNLRPSIFTSTPISKYKRRLGSTFFENSPIPLPESNHLVVPEQLVKYQNQTRHPISIFKVLGDKKIPLNIQEKRKSSLKKHLRSHSPMVVISDSEEEDCVDKEITLLQNMLNPSTGKKPLYEVEINQAKEEITKQIRNRRIVKPLKEDVLESESKKSLKRVSRVAAIIDEIMKERNSTIEASSPMLKIKSDNSIDAIVEKVMEGKNDLRSRRVTRSSVLSTLGNNIAKENQQRYTFGPNNLGDMATKKLKDIGNNDKINIKTTRKRTKTKSFNKIGGKENNNNHKKNELDVVPEAVIPLKMKNNNDVKKMEIVNESYKVETEPVVDNQLNIQSDKFPPISSYRAESFNELLPALYKPEEIEDNDWLQVTDQKGVFLKNNFRLFTITNGFVKIEPKCFLYLHSQRSQIYHVADGRGIFMYDNDNIKVKIAPGHTITVPVGYPCKISNSGIKKNLIISFTKIGEE